MTRREIHVSLLQVCIVVMPPHDQTVVEATDRSRPPCSGERHTGTIRTVELDLLLQDTEAFYAEFAASPGSSTGNVGGASWFHTGLSSPMYNGLFGLGDTSRAVTLARSWSSPWQWWVPHGTDGAAALERQLSEAGLKCAATVPGMVCAIRDLPPGRAADLTVEIVRTDAQFDAWASVFADAFGMSAEGAETMRKAHRWSCSNLASRVYVLISRDGEAIATGLLHTSPRVAGVYGIAVRRAYQRQGIGRLATLLTVQAVESGATLAVLQATQEGFPVYQKLGFRTLCHFNQWRLP
jgi:ribosomal protein S18 acetylase RimI-like enzyme